jgi:hypothetical protein
MISVRQRTKINDFKKQYEDEQNNREQEQVAIEHERARADIFQHPSDVLKSRCNQYEDDGSDFMTNAIAVQDAFSAFRLELDKRGVELLATGAQKVHRVGLINKGVIELRDPATWVTVYEYLSDISAFTRTDRIVEEQTVEPTSAPEQRKSLDELLETTDGTRRENAQMLRHAVEEAAVDEYFAPIFAQWVTENLQRVWNFDPNVQQLKAAEKFFKDNNLSPLKYSNFDLCRRELSRQSVFPEGMFTEDERLSSRLEHSTFNE